MLLTYSLLSKEMKSVNKSQQQSLIDSIYLSSSDAYLIILTLSTDSFPTVMNVCPAAVQGRVKYYNKPWVKQSFAVSFLPSDDNSREVTWY